MPGSSRELTVPISFAGVLALVAVALFLLPEDCEGAEADRLHAEDELRAAAVDFEVRNELEDRMVAGVSDADRLPEFYEALLDAQIFVVNSREVLAEARQQHRETAEFRLVDHRGSSVLPIFTSRERAPSDPALEVGVLGFSVVLHAMDPPVPILINMGSELPITLYLEEQAALKELARQRDAGSGGSSAEPAE